jgi:cyclic beta-1,2-glucan synthetase
MTGSDRSLRTLLAHATDWAHEHLWNTGAGSELDEEEPLRAALFSSDQMVAHGKLLAGRHRLAAQHRPDRMLARLAANERVLETVARQLRQAVAKDKPVTPASEWLLDNMYLIDEEIRTARRHLPHGYSRELPRLAEASPETDGTTPRVYDLALEAIAHADGRLSRGTLSRFVAAYQSGQPLKLGELWAFPIMLRLALIENLRRVAVRAATALDERDLAETWASRMLQAAEERPSDLILVIADMARSDPTLSSAFVAEFARRLQGQGAALALPLTWMEQRLSDVDETIEHLVHLESQKQAASQVSVSNSIGSLRLLGATHWPEFVETLSSVEQILRGDPAGVYGRMDFGTRDTYRHAVESVARASGGDEPAVARKAIELAAGAAERLGAASREMGDDDREAHVGYWLIGSGRPALDSAMGARRSGFLHRTSHSALPAYVGGIVAFAMLMSLGPIRQAAHELDLQVWSPKGLVLLLLLMLATSQLALSLVNWIVTLTVTPEALPRMDYGLGVDPRSRTLVAVPTLLGKRADVDSLVDALEVRFLANRDSHLQFALLTDLRDAKQETLPDDDDLVDYAEIRIAALNKRYAEQCDNTQRPLPFLLLHRPRRWNDTENVWMGRERKRGKLADLNALLRGRPDADKAFARIVGDTLSLQDVRYVITLDSDTQLPRESAAEMVSAMAHPLNRPRFGTGVRKNVVVEGYGILQPRVGLNLPSVGRSGYARMFGGEPGIDPYTRAVSDVYQDLLGEGSFVGKGIYDVDAFERATHDSMPENRILSHDLIEGCYARSGLLSDVQLLEDTPSRYSADMARRHRWVRGDWQLIGWLRRRLHALPGAPRNPLSALSKWKLFDNLRRSLVPAALIALAVLGWARLPEPFMWTLRVIVIVGIVPFAAHVMGLARAPINWVNSTPSPRRLLPLGLQLVQLVHTLACLPTEAVATLDAIGRTIWRMVRGRRLLEWTASADVRHGHAPGTMNALRDNLRELWAGPTAAILITALLADVRPVAIASAAPLLLLWLLSPVIVWWADRPLTPPRSELNAAQRRFLGRVARRTWAFFETFVGAEDNHLPPDNVQLHPVARIAHRTSPTNIGFSLLANLTAHDSGFITLSQMLTRIAATVTTMERMERHRGHFYNWYDTQSLLPLAPRYISTVDSGNLVAQLMTLRMALLALPTEAPFSPLWCQGLADLLGLVRESLPAGPHLPALDRADKLVDAARLETPLSATRLQAATASFEVAARELLAAVEAALADEPRRAGADEDTGEALRWARALVAQCEAGRDELAAFGGLALPLSPDASPAAFEVASQAPLPTLGVLASLGIGEARVYLDRIEELARRVDALSEQEQGFLYDDRRHLMAIGFNVDERALDPGHYDLLASEARLGIFTAIARGQLPQESWFALGRLLTAHDGNPVLVSWSGSMFEYLMPPLIMPHFEQTLLAETCRAAVRRQIDYGRERGVPWGISESGYNATDTALNYQYRAFGAPGLGLKRGLGDELVIAPYATAMAAIVEPVAACANLQRLQALGAAGEFGFYEAVDYTPMRVPRGQTKAVVRSFMAHHQGMSLLAIEQALGHSRMQEHFASDRSVQATMMLLHERVPKDVMPIVAEATMEPSSPRAVSATTETALRVFTDPQTPTPEVQLLSNGSYHVMVTQAGGGYSRYKDMAVTRWREDATRDEWGSYAYLRDVDSGEYWSTAFQPTGRKATDYQAIFTEGRAEFRRRDAGIDTHTEIAVSPEDAIELRRIRIKNTTRRVRTIEVTSYCEVVLMTPAADVQHPAFGKLFVQTELVAGLPALLANRRPRAEKDPSPWMFHLMAVHAPRGEGNVTPVTHETDRARFIGRGGTVRAPAAMFSGDAALSNSQGSVLDPVAASRCAITLEPDQTVIVDLVVGVGDQRADCLTLIEKYRDRRLAERVFELAWTHSQVLLRQLNASESDAQMYARLAGAVLFSQGALRADPSIIRQNRRGQSGLWGYAISGDLPIVLVQISDVANLELVRQLVMAHAWWRLKGLAVDLVIWNEERDVYRQRLHEQVMGLIAAGVEAHVVDRPGGIFVRHADQIPQEDRILLLSVARAVLSDRQGSLSEQLARRLRTERRIAPKTQSRPGIGPERRLAPFVPTRAVRPETAPAQQRVPTGDLALFNGYGGYAKDGREYVVAPPSGVRTPAPWANVIANPDFGTVISESGAAYTWAENAHEWRLTPWHNDPVSDPSGETFYLRDEETGVAWMPNGVALNPDGTPGRAAVARHGFGYSTFEQHAQGIRSELRVFCAIDAPVKFSVLTMRNDSGRPRRIGVTGYVEWVLGSLRPSTAPHIVTDHVDDGPAFARNPYSGDHADYMGFFDVDPEHQLAGSMTCDRAEFVGRNGNLIEPMALRRAGLSGRVGAALDPCAAFQVPIDLAEGESRTVVFRLGMGKNHGESERVALKYRTDAVAQAEFERVTAHWTKTLGAVQVRTPDAALNALANGWLVYQTISCRLWARSGYYQSGGAFGFRDQLQDAMALVHTRPELLRAQLLLAASRQFEEGDVQHWWHPPQGRGVRTHISDDYLWLPLGLCRYIEATGDLEVLTEQVNFIEGRPLPDDAESYFDMPNVSHRTATLYEHAALAVRHGLRMGSHGLPLMGAGDWNDGMNLIGEHGKGESVWMAFFVCEVLREFTKLARMHRDDAFAQTCVEWRDKLAVAIEANAWDGDWYRRAYFDDGTPLGTATGVECQIDSIAQSWSVLSGIAPRDRAKKALDSLAARLVNPQQRIVKLLDPPFNGKGPNPGYISGYVPGVRENGGQYTHGAIWAAMAFAASGDARRSWDIVDMINPVNHSRTPAEVAVYKVEPYVMSADVYSVAPHTGRGGWSWYTGSAGWMYRLLVEAVLGLRLEVVDGEPTLLLDPRIPPHWTSFEVDYVHGTTFFRLQFDRSGHDKEPQVTLDGRALRSSRLPLLDDGRQHSVQIALPSMMPVPTGESSELLL